MSAAPETTAEPPKREKGRLARMLTRAPWRLIGFALLIIVLANTDLKKVWAQFQMLGPLSLLGAAAAFLLLLTGRCWRWVALTRAAGLQAPVWTVVKSCNRAIWLGLCSPGRVGELRRAADFSVMRGWGLTASSGLVVFDLLFDLGAYAAIGIGGLLAYTLPEPWGPLATAGVGLLAVGIILGLGRILGLAAKLAPFLLKVPGFSEALPALRDGIRGAAALQILLATALAAAGYVTMIACLIWPMQLGIGLPETAVIVGLAVVAGSLPITYFGLGTRDVTMIGFFNAIGGGQAAAVAVSFSFLLAQLIGLAVSMAVGFGLGLLFKDQPAEKSESDGQR